MIRKNKIDLRSNILLTKSENDIILSVNDLHNTEWKGYEKRERRLAE